MTPSSSSIPDALPDFRNLGVVARILVGVNLGAFVAAAIKATTFQQLMGEFLEIAPKAGVQCAVTRYPLDEANEALADLREGRLEGAAVLVP